MYHLFIPRCFIFAKSQVSSQLTEQTLTFPTPASTLVSVTCAFDNLSSMTVLLYSYLKLGLMLIYSLGFLLIAVNY